MTRGQPAQPINKIQHGNQWCVRLSFADVGKSFGQFQGLGFKELWWVDPGKVQASRKMWDEACREINAIAEIFKDYRTSLSLSWNCHHIGQFIIPSLHRTILLNDGCEHFLNLILRLLLLAERSTSAFACCDSIALRLTCVNACLTCTYLCNYLLFTSTDDPTIVTVVLCERHPML